MYEALLRHWRECAPPVYETAAAAVSWKPKAPVAEQAVLTDPAAIDAYLRGLSGG